MAKSSKKLKIGHVQDTPVSTSMISNECMICHMKVRIVSYNLDQHFFSKYKIHILSNYEQTNLKTAIVLVENSEATWKKATKCNKNKSYTTKIEFIRSFFGGNQLAFRN